MEEQDFEMVCSEIDKNKDFLNDISRNIWKNPELGYQEKHAHRVLTTALEELDFRVTKNYMLPTAFKAEYSSEAVDGPTIAVLLEYDALPGIGHACGHNLIAEAGLAAGMAVKAAMKKDPTLKGKVVLLGTPAEETDGGKIQLKNMGAFDSVDAAIMAHPCYCTSFFPTIMSYCRITVNFRGKESHASASPWEGCNAVDAVVATYQNIALLRQQIRPTSRIHGMQPTDFSTTTMPTVSTDMGNVSHVVPSIQPLYTIDTTAKNHSKEFAEVTGSEAAQGPTLAAAKALAMTAIQLMRYPNTLLEEAKRQFRKDVVV